MRSPAHILLALLACVALAVPVAAKTATPQAKDQPQTHSPGDSDEDDAKNIFDPADILLPSGPRVLLDAATEQVLSESRSGETWYPASLTKLMTAYIIFGQLRAGALRLDQEIAVSELAHSQEPSKIGIPTGKTVSVDFALQALLVYSANDMAYVLAEAAAGNYHAFANEMNRQAQALGLSASHFVNPNGLFDPRHVTSARDIAVLAHAIITQFPEYSRFFSQPDLKVGKRRLANRNSLLRSMPDADGMKTGFVCNSGFNLVASASRNGRRLIAVVLGAHSGQMRARIARAMLEEGFNAGAARTQRPLSGLPDVPQGALVPADLTTTVCKAKSPVQLADGTTLGGWGISFGTYDSMVKADMALRGRLLDPAGINTLANPGVVKLPGDAGYAAALWNLSEADSGALCAAYQREGAHCDILEPVLLQQIAAASRKLAKPTPAEAQGSDGAGKKQVKKKRKHR